MKYVVLHESSRSIRFHVPVHSMSIEQADMLEYYFRSKPHIKKVRVYERTGNVQLFFDSNVEKSSFLDTYMSEFSFYNEAICELVPEHTERALNNHYTERIAGIAIAKFLRDLFLPIKINMAYTVIRSIPFIAKGFQSILSKKLDAPIVDVAAISASLAMRDFKTASSVMFLLDIGEELETWTHRKSIENLATVLTLKVENVWKRTDTGDILTDIKSIQKGEHIVVRTSNIIPLDAKVLEGEITVNEASMTGESIPVSKHKGGYVYAGTIVEDGSAVLEVVKVSGRGKYDEIVKMIEKSEKLKSGVEEKAFHLADRLVPLSLSAAAVTFLLTRNFVKAMSFVMVDFSCALKLAMPITMLSAIKESGENDISVKGGKFLEAIANADTIVFDKTGTLTNAKPTVEKIIPFGKYDETECLRIAACLEEHYPHSVANAVVNESHRRGIIHDEMHTDVQYVVAHGISSKIEDKTVIIGSRHFIFDDEKCKIPKGKERLFDELPEEFSHLFLAIDNTLIAVICISDPIKPEVPEIIKLLREEGLTHICMMTGDAKKTAEAVASKLDLDEYFAEVLPEDKAAYIRNERKKGHKVIMVGDGINDSPALSEADVGIAVCDGAEIAREIADITITYDDLYKIVVLRRLATKLMKRIDANYRFIMSFNGLLIGLGFFGITPPAMSSFFHNSSTIITGINGMRNLLNPEDIEFSNENPDETLE